MEGDGWETVEYECQATDCRRTAIGFLRVPVDIHPDERFVCCEDHGQFVIDVLQGIEYIAWLDALVAQGEAGVIFRMDL